MYLEYYINCDLTWVFPYLIASWTEVKMIFLIVGGIFLIYEFVLICWQMGDDLTVLQISRYSV